jgi:hypothetical protein
MADNLVNRGMAAINALPLCGARARSAGGRPCRRHVTPGRTRCRRRGGKNVGPPLGSQNGLIHGRRSRAAVALRKERTAASKAARAEVAAAIAQAEAVLRAAGKSGRRAVRAKAKGG